MHVKQYGENKLDFTYKIHELTVSTQEKDSGICSMKTNLSQKSEKQIEC